MATGGSPRVNRFWCEFSRKDGGCTHFPTVVPPKRIVKDVINLIQIFHCDPRLYVLEEAPKTSCTVLWYYDLLWVREFEETREEDEGTSQVGLER